MTLQKQKPPRIRHIKWLIIASVIGLGVYFWNKNTTLQHVQAQSQQPQKLSFSVPPDWQHEAAATAIGIEGYNVAATTGDSQPRPIASIAKVITALAIIDKHPLKPGETGPMIPITEHDEQLYRDYVAKNGTVVLVKARTELSLRDALEAMLLPSSNNIADTTAIWAFGSLQAYRDYANNMLRRLSLNQTTVGNDASGLDPSTTSTATDLIKLGEVALKNPVIAEIVALPAAEVPVVGEVPNYNGMVIKHGFSGLKPGESVEAGNTLLFSTTTMLYGKKVSIIGAILGTENYKQSNTLALKMTTALQQAIVKAKAQ